MKIATPEIQDSMKLPKGIDRSGYLIKEGQYIKSWLKRYMILEADPKDKDKGGVLIYHTDKDVQDNKGLVHLAYSSIKEPSDDDKKKNNKEASDIAITLIIRDQESKLIRYLNMKAESKEDAEEWKEALRTWMLDSTKQSI